MSVRDTEKNDRAAGEGDCRQENPAHHRSRQSCACRKSWRKKLGTQVTIKSGTRKGSGKLTIGYSTLEQLDARIWRGLMR